MISVELPLPGPPQAFEHVDTAPMGPSRPGRAQAGHTDEVTAPMGRALELDRPLRPRPNASLDTAPMEVPPTASLAAGRGPAPQTRPAGVPGRIAGGALRRHAAARVGAGLALGLGLGWALSQPYAGRAERRVAELRAQADRERYRPVDEARARVAALDAVADSAANGAALGAGAIWLVVGAAAFAGWWRLT
jgi:hypothetical protein